MALELFTKRLRLRRWLDSDRQSFADLNADPEVMRYFPATLSRPESDEMIDRMEAHHQTHGFGFWAVELRLAGEYTGGGLGKDTRTEVGKDTGEFIGFVGLSIPRFEAHFIPTVEVGWRLARRFWGYGYATEGAIASLQYGFEVLHLPEIVSFTATINHRSIAVMQRLGMTYSSTDDFDHPALPTHHPLQRHVLYRLFEIDYFGKTQK